MVDNDNQLRVRLKNLLKNGLEVELQPRAYDHDQVLEVVFRLQAVDENDYESKLKISGFTLTPWEDDDLAQACETCMYYKVHRKFCEIPELMLPVEPQWSCRIWRI